MTLAAIAAVQAPQTARMTFDGFGYVKVYYAARLVPEALLFTILPVTPQMLMSLLR